MIAARLLGIPVFTVDGAAAPPELLWRKHLAVCVVLWNSTGRRCSRDRLISYFWADKDEASARHSLNEALRIIRKSAGADALDTEDDHVTWVGGVTLDLDAFAAAEAVNPLQAAALVAGSFCEGLSIADEPEFDRWLDARRAEWNVRCGAVLLRAASAAEEQGDVTASLALALRATTIAPMSAEAARALIRARWLSGDRPGALHDGRAFAERLRQGQNLQPDAQTKALLARVAAGRTPRIHAATSLAPRRPPFSGRYQVLSRTLGITRAVVAEKRPALIVLTGESGSGRSRLLDEIVMRASLEGAVVSTMRAVDGDLDNPHSLWLGLASGGLLDAPGVLGAPTAILAGVAASSSEWAQRFPVTAGATGLPLSDAVTGIVRTVADENPLVLAIDDAHRLGERGLLRLSKLLRGLVGMPVTILVTLDSAVPSAAADEIRRAAERDTPGSSMRIDRWETGDIDQLVTWALPEWEENDRHRLARRLNSESAGRPSIAVELLAAVREGMPLDLQNTGEWQVPTRTPEGASAPQQPDSFSAAVKLAFAALGDREQRVLQAAALLPEPATLSQLVRMTDLGDPHVVEDVLDHLEWERWLVADGRGYSFPARQIRRLIETEILTPEQRKAWEERMVRVGAAAI